MPWEVIRETECRNLHGFYPADENANFRIEGCIVSRKIVLKRNDLLINTVYNIVRMMLFYGYVDLYQNWSTQYRIIYN